MFRPGARSLLELSLVRLEKRCHLLGAAAGMSQQSRVTLIQGLKPVGCGVDLPAEIVTERAPGDRDAGIERDGKDLCQTAEPGAERLLIADTLLQIRQCIVRDGLHRFLKLVAERAHGI